MSEESETHSNPLEGYSYSSEENTNGDVEDELQREAKSASSPGAKKNGVRFKDVASTVQTLQSASQGFKSSKDIREMAHKKWLADKEKIKKHKMSERRKEELAQKEKKTLEVQNQNFSEFR